MLRNVHEIILVILLRNVLLFRFHEYAKFRKKIQMSNISFMRTIFTNEFIRMICITNQKALIGKHLTHKIINN